MNLESTTIPIHPADDTPKVIPPDAGRVFLQRAARFRQLADGNTLGGWLRYLAVLSQAQHDALQTLPALDLPDAEHIAQAREFRMPPLPAQSWRDPAWHDVLDAIVDALLPQATEAARGDLERLRAMPRPERERVADKVLQADLYCDDAGLLPYVAAALQVVWTGAAARLGNTIAQLDVPGVCPCCGYLPVASVVRSVGNVSNLRYLHCALCNTEWNMVRVKCAACGADEGVAYRYIEGNGFSQPDAVRAETCDSCKSYLKIIYPEKGAVDPVADDLATLALDVLVDEAGYGRSGPNLLLAGI